MDWSKLIGKKVKALRGWRQSHKFIKDKTVCPLQFVLFDDGKTFIQFEEQSPYDYHDCCSFARTIDLHQCEKTWKKLMDKEEGYDEADDTQCPFSCPF